MVLFWLLSLLMGVLLFAFGYYLGHHVGATAHVRRHLSQARECRRTGQAPPQWPDEHDASWSQGW